MAPLLTSRTMLSKLNTACTLFQTSSLLLHSQRVVALLPDGETTLKTFFKEPDGRIRLQPANEEFDPIIVSHCTIQGVVVGGGERCLEGWLRLLRGQSGRGHALPCRLRDGRGCGKHQRRPRRSRRLRLERGGAEAVGGTAAGGRAS